MTTTENPTTADTATGPGRRFDAVELEILWQSLIGTVNEQARALQRAAFSPIVREAGDLANAVFDRRGRMVAQAVTGTPGHINSLAIGAANMLDEYPLDSIEPGDVLIFAMNVIHGAFDNESESGRCRLSTDSRYLVDGETPDPRWNGDEINPHGPGRVFYPGLGSWENADFQDEWKYVDERGRLRLPE